MLRGSRVCTTLLRFAPRSGAPGTRTRGAANAVDHCQRIIRRTIAAPGNMTVRPHEHELALVKLRGLRMVDLGESYRHLECLRGLQGLATIMTGIDVQKVFSAGSDVLTWYDMATTVADPVPVANWMQVQDGKITRIRVAFDPRGVAGGS